MNFSAFSNRRNQQKSDVEMFRTRSQTVHTTRPSVTMGRRKIKLLTKSNENDDSPTCNAAALSASRDALSPSKGKSLSPSQYSMTSASTTSPLKCIPSNCHSAYLYHTYIECFDEKFNPDQISPFHSQSDLTLRKSVFSRKSYGSADMLNSIEASCLSNNAGSFRVETGEHPSGSSQLLGSNNPIHVENPEFQTRWYFKYFLGRPHQNFIGADADRKEAFILSIILNETGTQYKVILWKKKRAQRVSLACPTGKSLSAKQILAHFDLTKFDFGPKEIQTPEIQSSLLQLEEQESTLDYKFGVLYAKEGQTNDDQMYSNETGSTDFDRFISLLGERVELKGWTGFRAGLDTQNGTTGTHSVYTVYDGHEIMWHVSTLLPYTADNRQQVERKRHVGNDIVNVIFVDQDDEKPWGDSRLPSWRPCMMKTHFTHIFAIVYYVRQRNAYRLSIFSHKDVPLFGPPLPSPAEFTDHKEFREFLLVKLINGEKSAFNIPVFAQKREKSIEMLIKSIVDQYYGDVHKTPLSCRKSMSEALAEQSSYQEARQLEFVKIGQTLKLRTILKGDAPTSLVTSSLIKREPWQPHPIPCDVSFDAFCGDSWGDKLVLSTTRGLILLDEKDVTPRTLIDNTVTFRELAIIEIYGLMVALPERGKKLYVIPLSALDAVLRARSSPNAVATGYGNLAQINNGSNCTQCPATPSSSATASNMSTGAASANTNGTTNSGNSQNIGNNSTGVNNQVSLNGSSLPNGKSLDTLDGSASLCCVAQIATGSYASAAETFVGGRSVSVACAPGRSLPLLLDKDSLKCCKLQKSKGCQLFCTSKPFSKPLQLLVCIGKKLVLFLWKSTILNASALSSWNQFQESNVESTFHFVREIVLTEQPEVQCFVDGPRGATRICVGYRNQYDLLDEHGDLLQSYKIDSSVKAALTPAISICADDEAELLLTFNNTSRFQKMIGTDETAFEFKWSTIPLHVVCAFPYIIGFSADTIEVRLIINGNLIYTRQLPNLQVFTSKCDMFFGTTALFANGIAPAGNLFSANSCCTVTSAATCLNLPSSNNLNASTPSSTYSGVSVDMTCVSTPTHSKAQLSHTRSIKFSTDHGSLSVDSSRRVGLYKIPLGCLTTGQCNLGKMRVMATTSVPHQVLETSQSSHYDRSNIAYSVQI